MTHPTIDLKKVNTYPLSERSNLVHLSDLIHPDDPVPEFQDDNLDHVIDRILQARKKDRPVMLMMGGHVIKSGLGPILNDLIRKGVVTHLAGNGAVSIHDFELALIGETSEDVATSIEDGSFGMAEETGALIHRAIRLGARDGLGYGESVGRFIAENEFKYRENSVFYTAYTRGVPLTVHITIGADIIHQHPDCDFGILGWASGQDFKIFCHSVSKLKGGVFLNFGSAVTGAEVFLKAVSITRNLGHEVRGITTANFDIISLEEDTHSPLEKDHPEYFYRPRKNIINRPTSLGGEGFHVQGDHKETLPYLRHQILKKLNADLVPNGNQNTKKGVDLNDAIARVNARSPQAGQILQELIDRRPHLEPALGALCHTYLAIAQSLDRGGTLFLYGNGGSMADALHISGELLKSYHLPRPLPKTMQDRLRKEPDGELVAAHLQEGLRVIALGTNVSLNSAVSNDYEERWMGIAQQLNALAKPGDVFLGISTSGKANNVYYAAITARASGMTTILLTGENESKLSEFSDISIHAPATQTDRVQEEHIALYHCLCDMLEVDFFGSHT